MNTDRKYLITVVLLAVLAVAFGVVGTFAPPLAEGVKPQQTYGPSSDSVGHFQNPPTYDSGWVDIQNKKGQYFNITHNLNSTEVVVDITGKRTLASGEHRINFGLREISTSDWDRTYGGTDMDVGYSVVQTSDEGCAVAGYTRSYGAGAPYTFDVYLVKTDSAGIMQWNKTYGGTNYEYAWSTVQTSDGGYAMAGTTKSYGVGTPGWYNVYLIKTDSTGTMQWNKTFGGAYDDYGYSIVQTSDGGYAIVGNTLSYGSDGNAYLVKTDSAGIMLWNQTYGGANYDYGRSVVQTRDGGYAIVGWTYSFGVGTPGRSNLYLVKTGASGAMIWNKTYGGANDDLAYSLIQTSDGGYALGGSTFSYPVGVPYSNLWLVRTDFAGNAQWNKTFGGAYDDYGYSIVQTSDGGYAISGQTSSYGVNTPNAPNAYLFKVGGVVSGLVCVDSTNKTVTLYRGATDINWNYVRVRVWLIREPNWIFGDINMDGVVDAKDLYIVGKNYGQTFSLLSLTGIIAVAGIRTVKKRKQNKKPNDTS